METVVGLFQSTGDIEQVVGKLRNQGLRSDQINVFFPGDAERLRQRTTHLHHPAGAKLDAPPPGEPAARSEVDYPESGQAIWALTGGGVGALAGISIASLALPGVGLVSALGLIAVGTLATAGAVGGALAGAAVEESLENTLTPADFEACKQALRNGYSVIFVRPRDDSERDAARLLLDNEGGETSVASTTQWVSLLRVPDAPQAAAPVVPELAVEEAEFRRGFEVAQLGDVRDQSFDEAMPYLRAHFPEDCQHAAFRRGFERGAQHRWSVEHPQLKP